MQIGLPMDIVLSLREKYQKGSPVELISMADDIHRLPDGFKGRLDHIDDAGKFHVKWQNGAMRALVMGEDDFHITPAVYKTIKYFVPISADRYERLHFGGDLDGPESMYDAEIIDNLFYISEALEKEQEEYGEKGTWEFYDEDDELKDKVKSIFYEIEVRAGKPWGVAKCVVCEDITAAEEEALREYISGDLSDGFGEGFEQKSISNSARDEIYVHFWQFDNWFLKEESELFEQESA